MNKSVDSVVDYNKKGLYNCGDEDHCQYHLGIDHCQTGNCCQDREHCQNGNDMQIDDQDQWSALKYN